ncbi:MAG: ribonuclease III [Actinomycetota bacterium]|nr:ribonuclease III [Actinomycetota bacterium]
MSKANSKPGVLEALGLPGEQGGLFELALTHRSYAYEQAGPAAHNERLELLGDAVLGLLVADLIYRSYPEMPEGEMATLRASVVNTLALARIARTLDLGRWLRLGRGEETTGGRDKPSVLADGFEAVIAASYLQHGLETVTRALSETFLEEIQRVVTAGESLDSKGALQELVVRSGGPRPNYELTSSGPDHDKRFAARVFIRGDLQGAGVGRSKKEAEQNAAREAIARMNLDPETAEEVEGAPGSRADARAS